MARLNMVPVVLLLISAGTFQEISAFVPVVMWGSGNGLDISTSPLKKISSEEFSEMIKKNLVDKQRNVAVFVQGSLSMEDLGLKDSQGGSAYDHLEKEFENSDTSKYFTYVHDPVNAFRSITNYTLYKTSDFDDEKITKNSKNLFFIELDEPSLDEDKLTLLRRHDNLIHEKCNKLRAMYNDVICVLTALRSSWIESNSISPSRKLLQATDSASQKYPPNFFVAPLYALFYTNKPALLENLKNNNTYNVTFTDGDKATGSDSNKQTVKISTRAVRDSKTEVNPKDIKLDFLFSTSDFAWTLQNISCLIPYDLTPAVILSTTSDISGSYNFSFHTPSPVVFNDSNFKLTFYSMQLELLGYKNRTSFSPAEDTVGFFTIPIWSGLFVTSLLVTIVFIGLSLIFDIKTMDQFDDPKGKTVTINASE